MPNIGGELENLDTILKIANKEIDESPALQLMASHNMLSIKAILGRKCYYAFVIQFSSCAL